MEFVEDHQPDAFQCRVVLQAARKDALGDHLDAGVRPDLAVEADAVAHRLADPLAQLAGGRSAAARAASRRGSSMMMVCPASRASPSSASGTRVVLPAPGGASSTASSRCCRAWRNAGRTSSIGRNS